MRKGMYLGIVAFNNQLTPMPIGLLGADNYLTYTSFVNGLSNATDGTALYYAVDTAIEALESSPLPPDLHTAALITFTDGYDNASGSASGDRRKYDELYGSKQKERIRSTLINGVELTAYAIGLKGEGTEDTPEAEARMKEDLVNLASSDDNWYYTRNMNEVNERFVEIANSLKTTTYRQNVTVVFNPDNIGRKYRFTLDGATVMDRSQYYIEVETIDFDDVNGNVYLEITGYEGITSMAMPVGTVVVGEKVDASNYQVTFTYIQTPQGDQIVVSSKYNISCFSWILQAGSTTERFWRRDTEFKPDNAEVNNVSFSCAAVILVLDCTSSLGNKFSDLRNSAVNFIRLLADRAQNEPERQFADINGDGLIDTNDANAIIDVVLGLKSTQNPDTLDFDGDGAITVNDAVMFTKLYLHNNE